MPLAQCSAVHLRVAHVRHIEIARDIASKGA
jgi:hypothetical protein